MEEWMNEERLQTDRWVDEWIDGHRQMHDGMDELLNGWMN